MSADSQNNISVFELLKRFQEEIKSNAKGLPSQNIAKHYWLGIGFEVHDIKFVAPVIAISEIVKTPTITHVPGSKPWVIGIMHLRGNLIPVTDVFAYITSGKPTGDKPKSALVTLYNNRPNAITVDRVLGLQRFVEEERCPADTNYDQSYSPYVKGMYIGANETRWLIFDIEKLTTENKFIN